MYYNIIHNIIIIFIRVYLEVLYDFATSRNARGLFTWFYGVEVCNQNMGVRINVYYNNVIILTTAALSV